MVANTVANYTDALQLVSGRYRFQDNALRLKKRSGNARLALQPKSNVRNIASAWLNPKSASLNKCTIFARELMNLVKQLQGCVSVFFKAMKQGMILLLCVHVSLNLIVPQHTRVITLVRIVLQQQLATEAKPRTKLTLEAD